MKKATILLLTSMILVGCNQEDSTSLNIVSPTGAPSLAFYFEAGNSNFETNSTPSNIVSMMSSSSSKDIVVIDTISGIKAINNGAPYQIASTITFGNFYLAATGNDEDNTLDASDSIILFGQNQTPDYIFHYLYGDTYDNTIEYVSNVQEAAKCLASGKNIITKTSADYVFIAEPALESILSNTEAATYSKSYIYADIQEEYVKKSNGLKMMQASVFVKKSNDKAYNKKINNYLESLKTNIDSLVSNPSIIDTYISNMSAEEFTSVYGINSTIAVKVLENNNHLNLGYENAYDNKEAIDNYISLFDLEKTDEEIYYK